MYIYTFHPILKSVIWGGDKIKTLKKIDTDQINIGESWEISSVPDHVSVIANGHAQGASLSDIIKKHGADLVGKHLYEKFGPTFPLLIKYIDAKRDLSLQVHPNDSLAASRHNSFGKTEMWYIIDAEPGAKIYAGLSKAINKDDYTRLVSEKRIMDVVAQHQSMPKDVYFIPAGRLHAIGAGNFLVEIQQTSDVTYRVYDYDRLDADGNPRQLHTELAKDAIDYTVYPCYRGFDIPMVSPSGTQALVQCDYFNVNRIDLDGNTTINSVDSFTIIMCLDGNCLIETNGHQQELTRGNTALIPAKFDTIHISGRGTLLSINA